MDILKAEYVYLLMNKEYHISRSVRIQWLIDHINKIINVTEDNALNEENNNFCKDFKILSIIPFEPPSDWSPANSHEYKYLITCQTTVIYLTSRYKIVFCLDMSPSLSAVDIQHGEVMIDEILSSLKKTLALSRPFIIPGSLIDFKPEIYVTVIAHTPFFTMPAQQVLLQGWRLTESNLQDFLESIRQQLEKLEDIVAEVSAIANDQLEAIRAEGEKLVGGLFEEISEPEVAMPAASQVPMVSPDAGFINMLRYGMLALRLLPESTLSNLVIVTDGIIGVPDAHVFDSVLGQLRSNTIACSFLHVGSLFHPHCGNGLVPYADLMNFIATATLGVYMIDIPQVPEPLEGQIGPMNVYHNAFLTWSLGSGLRQSLKQFANPPPRIDEWQVSNICFYGNRETHLLRKKQIDGSLTTSLQSVLCCRFKEGYIVKSFCVTDKLLEISLELPWKNHITLEYLISLPWGTDSFTHTTLIHYSVTIQAPYEFLHDITCLFKNPFKSPYRQQVVMRFWSILHNLTKGDQLLVHLSSFHLNSSYSIPETIRSGMPVFYLTGTSGIPVLSSSDLTCPKFAQFWRPVCMLEPSIWHKWLHTHRLVLGLAHDRPLPKHLHLANPSGRFQVVQCRQAGAALYAFLKKWSSFVLIENHSFVRLIYRELDRAPVTLCVLRASSKPPCVVLNMAFLGGTSSKLRQQVVDDLKENISLLVFPQRPPNISSSPKHNTSSSQDQHPHCCILYNKPIEKILIRYERIPVDLSTVTFPDGTQPVPNCLGPRTSGSVASGLLTTLSRYLHHSRWIWTAQHSPSSPLAISSIARILATITKIRLQEGFNFAHSTSGIINMVLEVQMKGIDTLSNKNELNSCVIQYVLFPPHITSTSGISKSGSSDDDEILDENEPEPEIDGEMQLVTEVWLEPQHGLVTESPPERSYLDGLPYTLIANQLCRVDAEVISTLLTFEQLNLICRKPEMPWPEQVESFLPPSPQNTFSSSKNWMPEHRLADNRIRHMPFAFDLMGLLPKCQQAELIFSMCIQEHKTEDSLGNSGSSDATNDILAQSLYLHLRHLHDRELKLSEADSALFLQQLLKRPRIGAPYPLPFNPPGAKGPVPRWQCYIKGVSVTHLMACFVPATYADLTLLLQTSFVKPFQGSEPEVESPNLNRSEELFLTPTFRHRASSWDTPPGPARRSNSSRARTGSMDSNRSPHRPLPSHIQRLRNEFLQSRLSPPHPPPKSSNSQELTQTSDISFSPVIFPIYIYDCPLAGIMDALIQKENSAALGNDVYLDRTMRPDDYRMFVSETTEEITINHSRNQTTFSNEESDNLSNKSNNKTSEQNCTDALADKPNLKEQCKLMSLVFSKCFVLAVFKSLHLENQVHQNDVQMAVDECEETLIELDITNYLKTVCGHLKDFIHKFKINKIKQDLDTSNVDPSTQDSSKTDTSLRSSDSISNQENSPSIMETLNESGEEVETNSIDLEQERVASPPPLLFPISTLRTRGACQSLRPLHRSIKNKFLEILTTSFKPVPTLQEYYFCSPNIERLLSAQDEAPVVLNVEAEDVDEEEEESLRSEVVEFTFETGQHGDLNSMDTTSEVGSSILANTKLNDDETAPLFLHLTYSLRFQNNIKSCSIRLLPTCIGELFQAMELSESHLDIHRLRITLDILCLTLPPEVKAVGTAQSRPGLRSTSFCSSSPLPDNDNDNEPVLGSGVSVESFGSVGCATEFESDRLQHLPEYQHKAVTSCISEMEWLMRDQIAGFLLNLPLEESTLKLVADHVSSSTGRSTCLLEKVYLDFVFGPEQSLPYFLEKLAQSYIDDYQILKENEFYVLVKDKYYAHRQKSNISQEGDICNFSFPVNEDVIPMSIDQESDSEHETFSLFPDSPKPQETNLITPNLYQFQNKALLRRCPSGSLLDHEASTSAHLKHTSSPGYRSEVSSLFESLHGTEDGYEGYEGDSSCSELDECEILVENEIHRPALSDFWLVLQVDSDTVISYFHCRGGDMGRHSTIHRLVMDYIKQLCKHVNQRLLLQNLDETRLCDRLLERESEECWSGPEQPSSSSKQNTEDPGSHLQARLKFEPGWFACPVVWQCEFALHPRLKTGPGKTGFSRGIQALYTVLNRFSVNNRSNMFVYKDKDKNVFYLRLHEFEQGSLHNKSLQRSDAEDCSTILVVSRSSSVTSLTHRRPQTAPIDHITVETEREIEEDTGQIHDEPVSRRHRTLRPRVRSLCEGTTPISWPTSIPSPSVSNITRLEDSVGLKVHGISEAGPDIKLELVQVLQNRLDDAVLEVLAMMLARNPMCKLTPDDVHFIQKPHKSPYAYRRFGIQESAFKFLPALAYYLKQNILQFLHIPKYTNTQAENHFQDYSEGNIRVSETELFLYNQSTSSGNGNKGIACIALAVIGPDEELIFPGGSSDSLLPQPDGFLQCPSKEDFKKVTDTQLFNPSTPLPNGKPRIEFRIWKQGRVNIDALTQRLRAAVTHACWDLYTEYCFLTSPMTSNLNKNYDYQMPRVYIDNTQEHLDIWDNFNYLHPIYQYSLQDWLKFGVELDVPSLRTHEIRLSNRHGMSTIVMKIRELALANASDATALVFGKLTKAGARENIKPQDSSCVVVTRNMAQWKASLENYEPFQPNILCPKVHKGLHKLPPLLDPDKQLVPRQQLFVANVSNLEMVIFMYNWSKERVENFVFQSNSLGKWLSSRSGLLTALVCQKLGTFYVQEGARFRSGRLSTTTIPATQTSPNKLITSSDVVNSPGFEVDHLLSFQMSFQGSKNATRRNFENIEVGIDVFRDFKPTLNKEATRGGDPLHHTVHQLRETKHHDNRAEEQKKLYLMWQTRGATPNIPLGEEIIVLFKQHSRLIHYCITPLLFLPRWRIYSAATRDYSLSFTDQKKSISSPQFQRSSSFKNKAVASSPKPFLVCDERWHTQLCSNFVHEYKQYLQKLGFIPIQTEPITPKKGPKSNKSKDGDDLKKPISNVCFLQKSLLGGILLFEIFLCEPFFYTKLYALECSRLQSKSSSALINQFTLSFLDECDKVKIVMHLHSFTYDFHLRSLNSYVSGKQQTLKQGYHLTQFLDDFLKYYSKAPNYARNLVYADVLTIPNLSIPARQLYDYLLSHDKDYKMEVFQMLSVNPENEEETSEYVLVDLGKGVLSYKDTQDIHHSDNFDVTLIVCQDTTVQSVQNQSLHLKYYIVLVSARELSPKLDVERRLGKFCPVSRTFSSNNCDANLDPLNGSPNPSTSTQGSSRSSRSSKSSNEFDSPNDIENNSQGHPFEIKQESVNYLGYYSSHEQLMQELMSQQATRAHDRLLAMVSKGAVHCRTHFLWAKLQAPREPKDPSVTGLTYAEFMELRNLAVVEPLSSIDPTLAPLLCQPLGWYQQLIRVLMSKYAEHYRLFQTADNNIQHLAVLHPRYLEAFMLLSIDAHTSRGDLNAVYRRNIQKEDNSEQLEFSLADIHSLIEGFVNACCFHLWAGLL